VNTGAVPVGSANVQALVGLPIPFANGSIFNPSIGNNSTTLTFTSPTTFNLTGEGNGNTTFGSCTFTFTQGPLVGQSVTFTTCSFQITASNVTVGGGAVSGTLTFTLGGPFGSGSGIAITVPVSILADGTLLVNGVSTGIIISATGFPTTTGTTGTGG
jgi:hypothetical protein